MGGEDLGKKTWFFLFLHFSFWFLGSPPNGSAQGLLLLAVLGDPKGCPGSNQGLVLYKGITLPAVLYNSGSLCPLLLGVLQLSRSLSNP